MLLLPMFSMVKFLTKFSDPQVAVFSFRPVARIGWRLYRPMTWTTQKTILPVLFFLLVGVFVTPACGVILLFKSPDVPPVKGRLVRKTDKTIVVEVTRPDGTTREKSFSMNVIDLVLMAVSTERLTELRPDKPQAYRDYAEELASKREDPEAREMAMRLYLMAANLAPKKLGRSSLLGMIDLAHTPQEERKLRAIAYLLDPEHDRRLLRTPAKIRVTPAAKGPRKKDQANLLRALRFLRQGNRRGAGNLLRNLGVKKEFAHYADFLSYEEILKATDPAAKLTPAILRQVLTLELALEGTPAIAPPATAKKEESTLSWNETLANKDAHPLPTLSLETALPGVDPQKCRYRDGHWVKP